MGLMRFIVSFIGVILCAFTQQVSAQSLPLLKGINVSHQEVGWVLKIDLPEYLDFLDDHKVIGTSYSGEPPHDLFRVMGVSEKLLKEMKEKAGSSWFLAEDELRSNAAKPIILLDEKSSRITRAHQYVHFLISRQTARWDERGFFKSRKNEIIKRQVNAMKKFRIWTEDALTKLDTPILRAQHRVRQEGYYLEAAQAGFDFLNLSTSEDIAIDALIGDLLMAEHASHREIVSVIFALRSHLLNWSDKYPPLVGNFIKAIDVFPDDENVRELLRRVAARRLELKGFVEVKIRELINHSPEVALLLAAKDVTEIAPHLSIHSRDFTDLLQRQLKLQHPSGCAPSLIEVARGLNSLEGEL